MEIKEAVDILKNKICDYVIPNYCNDCKNKSECLDDCNFILSIYTVLQEIEHLQKENEELKDIDLTTVHIKGVCDEKERWRNKIREKIEEIKEKYEEGYAMENQAKLDILQDLLKEE